MDSSFREAARTVDSQFGLPIICNPTGSLVLVKPQGMLAAGFPIIFIGNVFGNAPQNSFVSTPFILVGGLPTGNAGTEVVGVNIKSNFSKADANFALTISISPTARA